MKYLEIEDSNTHHKNLSPLDSIASINFMCYDQRQSRSNKHAKNHKNGKPVGQKHDGGSRIQNSNNSSRILAELEGKCLKCGKLKHQPGQKCSAHGPKCKACSKIRHFAKICFSTRRQQGGNKMVGNVQLQEREDDDTFVDEIGRNQPNSSYPKVNMIKLINTLRKQGNGVPTHVPEKYLKFKVSLSPWKTFNDQIIVRVDTGADANCMNEKTFNALFPEVKLSWCPYQIQNFGNSAADVQILGESQIFLLFKGKMYLHTFIVTNANDCSNLLLRYLTCL